MRAIPQHADQRPQRRAWAPGDYVNTCWTCENLFIGDKRAHECADCAYKYSGLTDDQIKHMVNRFLGWKLPKNFSPDDGISYTPTQHAAATGNMPTGTNLFDVTQAEAMVRYMVEGLPTVSKQPSI